MKKYQPYMSLPICYVHVYICAKVSMLNCLEFIFLHDKLQFHTPMALFPVVGKGKIPTPHFVKFP